jgi:hypothetical protein
LTNSISFSPNLILIVSANGSLIAKETHDRLGDFDFLYERMKAGLDRATKVALTRSRKVHNRRAYDNVHYVPALAA